MTTRNFLRFELAAPYATFRVAETTRGFLTFPFPPRTALVGLLAGIIGEKRNVYWEAAHPLRNASVACTVVNPIRTHSFNTNYIQTKSTTNLPKSVKIFYPRNLNRGFGTQMNQLLLHDAKYHIYTHIPDEDIHEELKRRLENRQFYYTPFAGHANLLATLNYLDELAFERVKIKDKQTYPTLSTVPAQYVTTISQETLDCSIVHNVPMSYGLKAPRGRKKNTRPNIFLENAATILYREPDEQSGKIKAMKLQYNDSAEIFGLKTSNTSSSSTYIAIQPIQSI